MSGTFVVVRSMTGEVQPTGRLAGVAVSSPQIRRAGGAWLYDGDYLGSYRRIRGAGFRPASYLGRWHQEDTDIKTFNLFGQFLMGFTGFARIGGFRMERWVADVLRGVPTEEYFNVLFREMAPYSSSYVAPKGRHRRSSPRDTPASSLEAGFTQASVITRHQRPELLE